MAVPSGWVVLRFEFCGWLQMEVNVEVVTCGPLADRSRYPTWRFESGWLVGGGGGGLWTPTDLHPQPLAPR